ncbi:hypothetical protein C4D60_Mb11t13200 [Musa balbisiana]|uniref:Pentacotripeptide-repeat region of PRORP domain-containing protein n=1 Tax=Musa balbisiana TaxID=52838 RepID=A0A4S8J677_MUSBA|nr:hypothetical protein C4D60_Mb11t13200 [Musa balbisiana]
MMRPRTSSCTKLWRATTKTTPPTARSMSSSGSGEQQRLPVGVDPCNKLCKIMLSSPNAGLEQALDASGVRAFPDVAEQVLLRFENAGMLAYRFFDWARRQQRGYAHTVRAYHTMIAALAKIRQYKLMWDLVTAMRAQGALNVETFCVIMRKYARAHKVEEALYTFDVMDKYGVAPNLAAFGGLLGALCKSKNVRKAQEVFDKMRDRFEPDAKTYSILLEGWGRAPNLPKMREVYQEMLDRGCEPDIVTYGIIVDALCKAGRMEEAVDAVRDMSHRGCPPTPFIYSVLVHTYGVEKRIEDAVDTFLEMERNGVKPDVVVYNALVGAFCKANKFENAFSVVGDMEDKSITPVARTFNIILNSLITAQRYEEAYRVFRRMIKCCEPDSDTYTMMIKMFCETNKLEMALKVWKYMGKKQFLPSMHTFSVLINGLCEKGELNRACVMLEDMIEKGIRPPEKYQGNQLPDKEVNIKSVFHEVRLCEKGELNRACVMLEDMIEKGIRPPEKYQGNQLPDKEVNIKSVFHEVRLCEKGELNRACVMLEDMIEKGIRPPEKYQGNQLPDKEVNIKSVFHEVRLCEKGELNRACVMLEDMIEKGIRPPGTTFGKLRQLLLKEGREDMLEFLVDKTNVLIQEPLCD